MKATLTCGNKTERGEVYQLLFVEVPSESVTPKQPLSDLESPTTLPQADFIEMFGH